MATDDHGGALLALLNSTPVEGGAPTDLLSDPAHAADLARRFGGEGTTSEVRELVRARDGLQDAARHGTVGAELDQILRDVEQEPLPLTLHGLRWQLAGPAAKLPAARAIIAWAEVAAEQPGRLRPCENPDCRKFLIDRSKGNTARWCSMATCGNRMKARRHYSRQQSPSETGRA
ncbi:CGNR zinc finger domain-containing protein [Isoptericola sp. S6320L]|uniref:CGNR zinc finger domain-containing protein n=1 Tax=Isoptericola sp. S6320L TaxID=2926411 RepID=UPI001FF3E7E7|nr:CGNR zinc finger domain-containing protein [Isoptericola sp. S6320L]MCK0115580.1 CGNR zinc finger domain-containing protein [Isoptericola sp. S6320L]